MTGDNEALKKALAAAAIVAAACSVALGDSRFRDGCSPLAENPARGAAPGSWHVLGKEGNSAGSPTGFCSWLWNIGAFSGGNRYGTNSVPACVGGEDLPLTDNALAAVSNTLVNARANGAIMIVRFGYTSGSEEGAEPSDFNALIGHVRQLGPILAAFPEVVLAVECGMVGPWGEMHSSNYCEPVHIRALMEAWLGTLAPDTTLLVRNPMWILEYADKDVNVFLQEVSDGTYCTSQPAQARLGLFNDGYLGTDTDYGTWRDGKRWMVREQGVDYLEARRNVPYGGELAHLNTDAEIAAISLFDSSRYNIVREFYRTHLSYWRNINTSSLMLGERLEAIALSHDHDFEGMPDLSEWYGADLRGFIRAHMGYRFVVRGVEFSGGVVTVTIENTGFGHLLVKSRGEISMGELSRGVDLDLRDLRPGERRSYALPLPEAAPVGVEALLSLRLDTSAAQAVHFANDAMRVGDAIGLGAVQFILGGIENGSHVGSAGSPVAWNDASNWSPVQVPGPDDAVNWASHTNSHRVAYVALDDDCTVGFVTNRWRSLNLSKSDSAEGPVYFIVKRGLGSSGYQHHVVNDGVRLVVPSGASLVWGLYDAVLSDLTLNEGASAEIFASVESQMTEYVVNDGASLVFSPSSYTLKYQEADGRYDKFSVNGGTLWFPSGINAKASSTSIAWGNVQQVNHGAGTVVFGGDFTSDLPWLYTWSGGTLEIVGDCAFGANVTLSVPSDTTVSLNVAEGKTFSVQKFVADSSVTILKSGGGVLELGSTKARIVDVDSGGARGLRMLVM